MAESKHTPGPWQRSGVRQSIPDFKGHSVGPDGDPVVIVPYNDKQHVECIANANLIAAAPELLDALKAMIAWGGGPEPDPESKSVRDAQLAIAWGKARAAIRKAEGSNA